MDKKKLLIVCLFAFLSCTLYGQRNKTIKDGYTKWSVQLGMQKFVGSETTSLPTTLEYQLTPFVAPSLSLHYNIYQFKNFNVRLGLGAVPIREIQKVFIDSEYSGLSFDIIDDSELSSGLSLRLKMPLELEYVVPLNSIELSINGGLELGFQEEFGVATSEIVGASLDMQNQVSFTAQYSRKKAPWYLNPTLGVGAYVPLGRTMIRCNVFYNLAMQNLFDGNFEFVRNKNQDRVIGQNSFRGNSYGFQLAFYFKKKHL